MKNIVMTFDDGLVQHLQYAAPLLKERGFNATFFITKGLIDSMPKYMNWVQVVELSKMGFELGNHCDSHHNMTTYSKDAFYRSIRNLEAKFAECGIEKPVSLAYPGFHVSANTIQYMQDLGYKYARAGCEKTLPFMAFQEGGKGSSYNYLYDNPYNINCLSVFGRNYPPHQWQQDLENLPNDPNTYGVLCFHCFDTDSSVTTAKSEFESLLEYLAAQNYNVIALKDIK